MLQKNPFFSTPVIYYGKVDENDESEEEIFNLDVSFEQKNQIGLFIHWFENEEISIDERT